MGHLVPCPSHRKLHFPELSSTSCPLPPQTCLNWLGHSAPMFYFSVAELGSGSNPWPPDAPIRNCPGGTSRGSQQSSDSSARQGGARIKATSTSQKAWITFSPFQIHRTKYTADCEVWVNGKLNRVHPFRHKQLFTKHLIHARLDTACEAYCLSP